jgi:hypothetical protein
MKTDHKSVKGTATARRGNVLDAVIIVVLLLAIVGIGLRYYTRSGQGKAELLSDAEITFEIKDAIFTLPSYVQSGDSLYTEEGTCLGVLKDNNTSDENTALYVSAAAAMVTDKDGNYIRISYPDSSRVDCIGTVSCRGMLEEDGSFLLDGVIHVTPGSAIRVHTETAAFTAVITACTVSGVQ